MVLSDLLARIKGRPEERDAGGVGADEERLQLPAPPTAQDLLDALDSTESLVLGGAVPSAVTARVQRVVGTVRDTIPRLDRLGAGSPVAYSVMATATDYLPEAVGAYLRLPRRFADTRPVDGAKTALMVLVDQLDLLGSTMDRVFDAVYRDDANALVAHGRFLVAKFGHRSSGGELEIGDDSPVPAMPETAGTQEPDGDETSPAADPGPQRLQPPTPGVP